MKNGFNERWEATVLDFNTHLEKASNDKYSHSIIDMKSIMDSDIHGKSFNMGNALKYMTRYMSVEGEKINNSSDLLKIAHYCLLEYARNK
jgi:hypothetical protein